MESTSVLDPGFLLDELHVEELEPRLEFTPTSCLVVGDSCTRCYYADGTYTDCGGGEARLIA